LLITYPNNHYSGHCRDIEEANHRRAGKDMLKEMWTSGFKYCCGKIYVAAQNTAG